VAEVDGKIVGAAEVKRDLLGKSRTHHVAIFGISILSEARGMGLGHELTQMCIDHASSYLEGIKLITLTAFSDNDRALSLYEKYGFKEVGRVPNAYFRKNQYSDQVIMAKELA
jgi:putative acetyltransferase